MLTPLLLLGGVRRQAGAAEHSALGAADAWERFVGHLRAGQMPSAYRCFSPLSRKVFSYDEFLATYNPLTAASEAVLAPSSDGQLRVSGDMALFRYVARAPQNVAPTPPDKGVLVTAMLVREENNWYLVAAKREAAARTESEARALLRRLHATPEVRHALSSGEGMEAQTLATIARKRFGAGDTALALYAYTFAVQPQASGAALTAMPRQQGLRRFIVTAGGVVRAPDGLSKPEPGNRKHKATATSTPKTIWSRGPGLPPVPPERGDPAGAGVTPARDTSTMKAPDRTTPDALESPSLPPPPPDRGDPASDPTLPPPPPDRGDPSATFNRIDE